MESKTFLVNRKAFLFVSKRDLRLKLGASATEARKRGFDVGSAGWVKLDLGKLPPPTVLKKWIAESHALFSRSSRTSPPRKSAPRKAALRKPAR